VKATEYHVVLTNNRTPLDSRSHSPRPVSGDLLDVGKILLRLGLDSTPFPDLGTSARLSLSITIAAWSVFQQDTFGNWNSLGRRLQLWVKVFGRRNLTTRPTEVTRNNVFRSCCAEDPSRHSQVFTFTRFIRLCAN